MHHFFNQIIPMMIITFKWTQCSCSSGQRQRHDSKSCFAKKRKREKCFFSSSEKWETFESKFNFSAFPSFISSATHLESFLLGNKWTQFLQYIICTLIYPKNSCAKKTYFGYIKTSFNIRNVNLHFNPIRLRRVLGILLVLDKHSSSINLLTHPLVAIGKCPKVVRRVGDVQN